MNSKYHNTITSALSCLLISAAITGTAQSGTLDTSFGSGGKVLTPIGSSIEIIYSLAIQNDGKIIAAGYSFSGTAWEIALTRYLTDGSLDNSFGTGGIVKTNITNYYDIAKGVALQNDGKIVVAGRSNNADFCVARYNTDGSPDTTFGSGGIVTTDFGGSDGAAALAIQSNGKIVAAGWVGIGTDFDFALARYNTDGTLDLSFGTGGKVVTPLVVNFYDAAFAILIDNNGKPVAVGESRQNGADHDFAIVRYNTNGSLDNTFGTNGISITAFGLGDDVAYSAAFQSDGKIVATGMTYNGNNMDFAMIRCNTDGSLDSTFGTAGKVVTPIGNGDDESFGVIIQSDGKIVSGGWSNNGSNTDFALVRFNSDGSLDNTFGTGGKVTSDLSGSLDEAYAVAMQNDGKILIAGNSWNGTDRDFSIARYNNTLTGVNNIDDPETKATIYPNPTNSSSTLLLSKKIKNAELTVYDIYGQVVRIVKNISGNEIELDRGHLPYGIYFIRLEEEDKLIIAEKLILSDN